MEKILLYVIATLLAINIIIGISTQSRIAAEVVTLLETKYFDIEIIEE